MKNKYVEPLINCSVIEMEEGLAALSGAVTFGGTAPNQLNPTTPDWVDQNVDSPTGPIEL
ncbi:hypothetical protein LZQ00_00765 [Sphingobacterium sp. SRCM116780]|uniref:hypothetical protein n=1 Tax=Sphingobacterium sp. SRCM116780 TaxID=2907623 RepID=UPI001F30BF0A|nr:hypothetical protein [Sphingobacterium sp. SRCM116780]UIR56374.1 hypothetical protein LZQ00_00765 [Sphingobacterium sp. SRCM116780]